MECLTAQQIGGLPGATAKNIKMPSAVPSSRVFISCFLIGFTQNVLHWRIANSDNFGFTKGSQSSLEILKQHNTAASKGKQGLLQASYMGHKIWSCQWGGRS